MKKFLTVVAVIMVLAIAGIAYIYVNLGGIAKNVIEKVGSTQLGVPVTIASLDIDVVQKSADMQKLVVGIPSQFSADHTFSVSQIGTKIGNLQSDLITIDEVVIGDINVVLEVLNGTTNIQEIQKNLPKSEGKSAASVEEGKGDAAQSESSNKAPDVIIKKIVFGTTTLDPRVPDLSALKPFTIPGFTLTNIGTAENGISPAEAARQILAPYLKRIENQAIKGQLYNLLPADKLDELRGKVEGELSTKLKGKLKEKLGDNADALDEAIGGKLDSLFGK